MSPPRPLLIGLSAALVLLAGKAAQAGEEATASKSVIIQPSGPREGRTGEGFFNVEGKKNGEGGKYASFGLLEFPSAEIGGEVVKAGELKLTLVQSVARFSVDGRIKFYLATGDVDPKGLKFDPSGIDGLGSQVAARRPLGSGEFKKGETGHADTFALTLDDEARKSVSDRAAKGEPIRIVVAPDDEAVAATYFGAGSDDASRRPRLAPGKAK